MTQLKKMHGTEGNLDYFIIAKNKGVRLGIKPVLTNEGVALRVRSVFDPDKNKGVSAIKKTNMLGDAWSTLDFKAKSEQRYSLVRFLKYQTDMKQFTKAEQLALYLRGCTEIATLVKDVLSMVEDHLVSKPEHIIDAVRKTFVGYLKPSVAAEETKKSKEEKKSEKAVQDEISGEVIDLFPTK